MHCFEMVLVLLGRLVLLPWFIKKVLCQLACKDHDWQVYHCILCEHFGSRAENSIMEYLNAIFSE